MSDIIANTKSTKRTRRMAREPKLASAQDVATVATDSVQAATPSNPTSKASLVLQLLQRPEGATIAQLVAATGWLPHTTRAALTGLKKKGHKLTSSKADGDERVYRVVAG